MDARVSRKMNKINTKMPVPHFVPKGDDIDPKKHYRLNRIPESGDVAPKIEYEMPNPELPELWETPKDKVKHGDYLLLDRARVLKRAMERVIASGGFKEGANSRGRVWQEAGTKLFEPLPLSVVEFDPQPDSGNKKTGAGESDSTENHTYCHREGRCTLGCLPSARHTLYKTLQQEQGKGKNITVLPLTKVSHIDRKDGHYVVRFKSELKKPEGKYTEASAEKVFLGGGCLGTTEIMLRTKDKFIETDGKDGLPLSDMVGKNFSTNGDFFAFSYNLPRDFKTRRKVEDQKRLGNGNPTVGPINSSHFYVIFDEGKSTRVDVNVEDAGIPTMFARLVYTVLPSFGDWDRVFRLGKALLKLIWDKDPFPANEDPDPTAREQAGYQTEHELVANVFFYNLMGTGPN